MHKLELLLMKKYEHSKERIFYDINGKHRKCNIYYGRFVLLHNRD